MVFLYQSIRAGRNNERRSAEQIENNRMEQDRLRHLHENMTPDQIENDRLRHLHENMTPDQIENARLRHLHENMTPDQIGRHIERNTYPGMTSEQIERHQQRVVFKTVKQEWNYERPCDYCSCIHLKSASISQRKMCCQEGKFIHSETYPRLFELPMFLKELVLNRTEHISSRSSFYNNMFSIAVTGYDNGRDNGCERINGPSSLKMNGRSYHYIPNSNNQKYGGIANFTYDGSYQVNQHIDYLNGSTHDSIVQTSFVRGLHKEFLENNSYCSELRRVGNIISHNEFDRATEIQAQINKETNAFEVGVLVSHDRSGEMVYSYKVKGEHLSLPLHSKKLEPLVYPMLFPHGEDGWNKDIQKEIKYLPYLASRLLMPETDPSFPGGILLRENKFGKLLPTNRFQLMSRVMQHYVVESLSRLIDTHLSFIKSKRGFILGDYSENADGSGFNPPEVDAEREEFTESSKTFLNDSIHGSPRHLKGLAKNCLQIVAELNKPHGFLTLTANPEWPEITEKLFPGQIAYDRPDVVDQVFHARLEALVHNLRKGKYFDSKIIYIIRVIEYQFRGLPHSHIVFRLEYGPNHQNDEECILWIDKYICTTMPKITENSCEKDRRHVDLLLSHMIHKCFRGVNGCINEEGFCKRKYSDQNLIPETYFDDNGYPVYRRPHPQDLRIVAHVKEILLDWEGHANMEFAASTYCVFYLFSYICKGNKKVEIRLNNTSDIDDNDEISLFLRGRMLTSMDAVWRIFGYKTYPATEPYVRLIKVKLPRDLEFMFFEGKLTDLYVYFQRPSILFYLKYSEFYNQYCYKNKLDRRFITNPDEFDHEGNLRYYEVPATYRLNRFYIYRREKIDDCITRIAGVPPDAGEIWYLRLLLREYPASSYQDLLTYENVVYSSFQQAAYEKGLLSDDNEAMNTFQEALLYEPPSGLRYIFCLLTMQGFPTLRIYDSVELRAHMYADYIRNDNTPAGIYRAEQRLLEDMHDRFSRENKKMQNYGLPKPNSAKTELERENELILDTDSNIEWLRQLHLSNPNTNEMQLAYDDITSAISNNETKLFFIRGCGGAGKTQFAKKIVAFTRSLGKIIKGCASTALAAQVYEGLDFDTAHSLFNIPVFEDEEEYDHINEITCDILKNPDRTELIEKTSVIIWDEFLSNHKYCFNSVYNSYNKLEGKVVIVIGDDGQIGPVVVNGNRSDTVQASPLTHYLWSKFHIYRFNINLRLLGVARYLDLNDPEQRSFLDRQENYAEVLKCIRLGNKFSLDVQQVETIEKTGETLVRLPNSKYYTDIKCALSYLYPQGFQTPDLSKRAILCATNEDVDEWNCLVQEMNPEPSVTLIAANHFKEVDDPKGILKNMLTDDACMFYKRNGVPDHRLTLKKGDLCFVMRTLNRKEKLANNTRVRILEIYRYSIKVITVSDFPKEFLIPRIRFHVKLKFGGFTLIRTQFPLRLSYAMTKNKSQGQSIPYTLNDIRHNPFSHGHLYVSMSRATDVDNTAFFCNEEQVLDGAVSVVNVVYPEMMLQD